MMVHSRVTELVRENKDVFTMKFDSSITAKPGQFLMIWVPGGKEIPMSLSNTSSPPSITFRTFGETTKTLSRLKIGDRVFYRGPYGNSYPEPSGKVAYVGGGTGVASLNAMILKYRGDVFVGARTRDDLFLIRDGYKIATDDGSLGFKGTVIDLFLPHLSEYDYVFVCGPEPMVKSFIDRVDRRTHSKVFFSLERLMKCGVGICDSCSINGYRVCKDGTIFSMDDVLKMTEFGVYKRSESGKMEFFTNGKR
ncbi:MAG: dihydroorotate dehydrogenase electron transfer subunit [Thermoplasmatales archaeon]|nr:dihydroorotate dehydrogenase electron transfer subunit [Candidatus Thermoplasmatota archaeon]MCL6002736.1 dihydroorotate dehydrogenase electron transfer subunit [Candidatus Thermoplasmatota archaeon]MDA8054727.1 dihydroorotate dehydrogenase electron transfer subunit [Thermoplasmatales archaeon]